MTLRESEHISEASQDASEEREMERIVSPALRYHGELFLGANHGLALVSLQEQHANFADDEIEQGFTTSTGRFVGRAEAHDIAVRAGQASEQDDGLLRSQHLQ